ncbi:hypothetical protein CWI69_07120 [Pseudidiomarina halophila]|uniref:Transposase n=1 Tax=Pseudidiomarina halophila TaxID=1449799 RepID=A0A432XVN9_9GAMM|nr:hypothetical protein CWI69_07120 [Pseudidiomarina halophila]
MERIEIFTGEQRRRRYTPQEKAKFVAMTMQPGYSVSLVACHLMEISSMSWFYSWGRGQVEPSPFSTNRRTAAKLCIRCAR